MEALHVVGCNMFLYVLFFFTKAFSMLANHVLSNMKIRKGEQRRDSLLARLNVDTDQLLGEPKIKSWCLRGKKCLTYKKKCRTRLKQEKARQAVRCMFHIRYIQDIKIQSLVNY